MTCHFCQAPCDPDDFFYCCGIHVCLDCNNAPFTGEGHVQADHCVPPSLDKGPYSL